ncbi:MAG: efflux RND transporter periplasmic adaptor subunit [Terriglobales bacterium]
MIGDLSLMEAPRNKSMTRRHKYFSVSAMLLVLSVVVLLRLFGRSARAERTDDSSIAPAAVTQVKTRSISNKITLSGEFVPFQEVDVHAKVSGYIRKIYVDVGDRVKSGQLIAVLEVPELSAELQGAEAAVHRSEDAVHRAKSDLSRAQSLHVATHLDYTRLKQASDARPGIIAQQELDNAQAKDQEAEGQIASGEAALSEAQNQLGVSIAGAKQFSAMNDYTRIVAPFDGVITRRNVNTGALVQAGTGSNAQGLPVVSVAQTNLFRLTLPVPESAVPSVHLGTTVTVHVQALNRDFEGKVARFSDAVNQETRTMHTEVDVKNKDGSLVQGMYAEVALNLTNTQKGLVVPIQALTKNGSKTTVLVVNAQDRIEPHEVQTGIEGANFVEISSGLNPNDRVVVASPGEFQAGEHVAPKMIAETNEAQF